MFALLIPSRPLIPSPTATLSPTQCSFTFPSAPSFSHLSVLLVPGQTLAPGTLAAIYIQLPPSSDFKLLGALSNEKQSALFRVNAGKAASSSAPDIREEVMMDDATEEPATQVPTAANVTVGISVEPAVQIQPQLEAMRQSATLSTQNGAGPPPTPNSVTLATSPPTNEQIKTLAQRIGQNAFNFLSSFTERDADGREMVPMRAFQDWWGKFERKVGMDATFLLRDGEG
ncbi:MAG: hypothetical protein Q9159_001564 [Coniocarpon cinnabarinum]